jgi:hypothetical protein
MTEQSAFRLANALIFAALVAGVVLVTVLDVTTARRVVAYAVILVAWVVAMSMNTVDHDKADQQQPTP